MAELNKHWTERDLKGFLYRLGSDFVAHVEGLLARGKTSQADLARGLGVSQGRVSQMLNNPGNLTLMQIIRYARILGEKVAIVAYDDNDPNNINGPVSADIFSACWERAGRPTDHFQLAELDSMFLVTREYDSTNSFIDQKRWREIPNVVEGSTSASSYGTTICGGYNA